MKNFCISLRERAASVINFEKNKMLRLAEEELQLNQDSVLCYICRKKIHTKKF